MEDTKKIIEGLEKAFVRLIAYKKYKNTPLITMKDGEIIEIAPDDIRPVKYIHR